MNKQHLKNYLENNKEHRKNMKYYTLECPFNPDCGFKQTGNSKRFLEAIYVSHYFHNHYHKPIIYENRQNTNPNKKPKI